MHLFSHRPLSRAQTLTEANRPQEALKVIEAFIAAKEARLPQKRCSRLLDAVFLRDNIIKPACPPFVRDRNGVPSRMGTALDVILEGTSRASSALSSYAHASQDSVFDHPLAPPLAPRPRPMRAIPLQSGVLRPRVRPPSLMVAQPRPISGLSDVSVLSDMSIDRAVVSEATVAHFQPAVFQTLHFVPSQISLASPR